MLINESLQYWIMTLLYCTHYDKSRSQWKGLCSGLFVLSDCKGPILYCFSSISHSCQRHYIMHCPKPLAATLQKRRPQWHLPTLPNGWSVPAHHIDIWALPLQFFSKIAGVWEAFSHSFLWGHFHRALLLLQHMYLKNACVLRQLECVTSSLECRAAGKSGIWYSFTL